MEGKVMRSTGSWYDVLAKDDKIYQCRLRGKFKIQGMQVTNPIAVGDDVILEKEGEEGTAVITQILPRENYIIRRSTHKQKFGHILAANIDQAILLATLVYPKTSLGFIDRFLVSAESFRIPAAIVFNKSDILDKDLCAYRDELMQTYEGLGYKCLAVSAKEDIGMEEFKALLHGKISLLSGHSGVGKSTLVNKIAPDINQKTSEISNFANKGVHTTTFAEMFKLAPDTFIIDSPGIKELGLMDIGDEELSHYFPELRDLIGKCKYYNCTHIHEPGCAIVEALDQGKIAMSRYDSYLSILEDEDNRR
jgi:ribosome biogenesis GTPase / thiamine phosphate phosphatase